MSGRTKSSAHGLRKTGRSIHRDRDLQADHTLFFTYGDKPNQVRVGTYICEQGGTLKIFTLSYVEGKDQIDSFSRKIEITFPSPDTLKMDVKPANEVWTYERIR